MAENPGRVVTRYSFCSVFAVAWLQAMSMKNVIARFKVAAIFPIDRRKLVHCDSPTSSLLQNVDPAYIPMLTPTPHTKKIATSNPITSEHKLYYERQQPKSTADSEEKKSKDMLWKEMYFPYRLTSDENPPKKVAKLCPDAETAVVLYSKRSMPIEKILQYPTPIKSCNNPASKCIPLKNCSSRVLTSSENLAILEEKQRKRQKN